MGKKIENAKNPLAKQKEKYPEEAKKWQELRDKANFKKRNAFSEMLGIPYITYTQWEWGSRKAPVYMYSLVERLLKAEGIIK